MLAADPRRPGAKPGMARVRRALGEFSAYRAIGQASIWGVPLFSLATAESLGRIGFVGPNSGQKRDSLIRAEISLIADLNSLQGRKKFPVRMRRELAGKALIYCPFLLPFTRRRAPNRWNSL